MRLVWPLRAPADGLGEGKVLNPKRLRGEGGELGFLPHNFRGRMRRQGPTGGPLQVLNTGIPFLLTPFHERIEEATNFRLWKSFGPCATRLRSSA